MAATGMQQVVRSIIGASRSGLASATKELAVGAVVKQPSAFADDHFLSEKVPGWLQKVNAAVIWQTVIDTHPAEVVEIGSYLGKSTVLIGRALLRNGSGHLTAIDPHTGDRQHLEQMGVDRIPSLDLFRVHTAAAGLDGILDTIVATSDEAAPGYTGSPDFLYVDGWHSFEAVRSDCLNWVSRLSTRGVVCFDDYGVYDEIRRAVDETCAELGITVYGEVFGQGWAGRAPVPSPAVATALRISRLKAAPRRR
jgi:hypothetical protein